MLVKLDMTSSEQNIIARENMIKLWHPSVIFENTDTGQYLVDTESNEYNCSLVQRF